MEKTYKAVCKNCGYETNINISENEGDCPICMSHKTMEFTDESKKEFYMENMIKHIQEGMKIFGIEGLIEEIERNSPNELMRNQMLNIIKEHFIPNLKIHCKENHRRPKK